MAGAVGLVVNPASGKDIRRLVASASVFDNGEKVNIARRAALGALAAGADRFVYLADSHGLAAAALAGLDDAARVEALPSPCTASALDTVRAAEGLWALGAGCVITLGGDGTNRAFARGWPDAPLVAVSTGTNNVFTQMIEGTVAGAAAGLIACGVVRLGDASRQAKMVHIEIDDEPGDLALIDAVLLDEAFVGARAIWNPARVRTLVLARAEPAVVGMSAIGGMLDPVPGDADAGLVVEAGPGCRTVTAPIAPGLYAAVQVRSARRIGLGEVVEVHGPGVLALDGERERRLKPGQGARFTVRRDGPMVVDVPLVMNLAASLGFFQSTEIEAAHGH